jgi:hypothetical protein
MKPVEDIATKLKAIEESFQGIRSKTKMLAIVCENTERLPDVFKYFNNKVNGHTYRGYAYLPFGAGRDVMFGSLFYFLDGKAKVLRAYPKIQYADSIEMQDQYVWCEEKVDGTNLCTWYEPSIKQPFTKTRGTADATGTSYNGIEFLRLAEKTMAMQYVRTLAKDDYTVFTELYGYENPCEYIHYTIPIAQKGLDVIDKKTHRFLPYSEKKKLFDTYQIEMPILEWEGILTQDKLEWMVRRSAEKYGIDNGSEGMVAKSWVPSIQDQAFGKIKCEECRQLAYIMAGGQIKLPEIKKAVRKALEGIAMTQSFNELMELARQELLEDYPESLVNTAGPKIREQLDYAFPQETFKVWINLDNMKLDSYKDKAKVMPALTKMHPKMSPGAVYNAYCLYLRRKGE